jgi:hypothetical protein
MFSSGLTLIFWREFGVGSGGRAAAEAVRLGIEECALRMDAVVESMAFVYGEPEGFAIVVARVEAMYAHEGVLTAEPLLIDPNLQNALIFSYRTYCSADFEMGRMTRTVLS